MSQACMTAPSPFQSMVPRLPGLLAGPGLIALGTCILIKGAPVSGSVLRGFAIGLVILGSIWACLSVLLPTGRWWQMLRWTSLNLLVLLAFFFVIEVSGRVAKINFGAFAARQALKAREAYPVWAREPSRPLPSVFFQHPGPLKWTGQPIRTLEVLRKGTDNAYVNEPSITVEYDKDGFRNPSGLADWDAAIVGDSYTELGYLPADQMSSSVAAARTGLRVKNLGVCNSGLLSYAAYLNNFGRSASCKRVVFVMFEGNDVQDTTHEFDALEHLKLTGQRDCKEIAPQYSFARAATEILRGSANAPHEQSFQNAWFRSAKGEVPITVSLELPINPEAMSPSQILATKAGIKAIAAEARAQNLQASLVYIPFNNRVYHGMVRFDEKVPEEVRNWQPHGLAEWVAAACKEENIAFFDAFPPMRAAAEHGAYLYNRILDCHVNAEGAQIIGEVIAQALKPAH